MTADNFDFRYKGEFNPDHTRAYVGLDGHSPITTNPNELCRLASMLLRGGYISEDEILFLGIRLARPGSCPVHPEVTLFIKISGEEAYVCPMPHEPLGPVTVDWDTPGIDR